MLHTGVQRLGSRLREAFAEMTTMYGGLVPSIRIGPLREQSEVFIPKKSCAWHSSACLGLRICEYRNC
jgi:hypothetical protein